MTRNGIWSRLGCICAATACAVWSGPAFAQSGPPTGQGPLSTTVDVQVTHQSDADLDGGGRFSVTRTFVQAGVDWSLAPRNSIGLSFSGGYSDYDFSGGIDPLWDDVSEAGISLPMRFGVGDRGLLFVIPALRFASEDGADLADGRTAGLFGAIAWRINDRLTIGPGFGVFEELSGDFDAFPILAIDWRMTDRLSLSTLRGIGATQGPGLSLLYATSQTLEVGLAFRFDNAEFRLSDDNAVPGGVGRVDGTPIVATVAWVPSQTVQASAFAGVRVGGELEVYDAQDALVSRAEYDTVPVFGGQLTLRF